MNKEVQTAKEICQEIESSGFKAYIVGGAARDILLGTAPDDVDIATNMPVSKLEKHFQTYEIGKSKDFGIVVAKIDGLDFEIAQFRGDGQYSDGRRPDSVEFLPTFEGDAKRRDFTINALAMKHDGTIVDYVNGRTDLDLKILRTVGDPKTRFNEDYLRIMRLARFAAKLNFTIDKATKFSAKKLAGNIAFLAKERISDELKKAAKLGGFQFARYIKILDELKVLQVILPEVSALKFKPETPANHPEGSTTFLHTLKALESIPEVEGLELLAVLFHDLGKAVTYEVGNVSGKHTYYGHDKAGVPIVQKLGLRLKFSNREIKMMEFCCENHMRFHRIPEMKKSKIVKLVKNPDFGSLAIVCKADSLNRRGYDKPLEVARRVISQHKETKTSSLVSGKRVMELLNLEPGRKVGKIKKLVTDHIINSDITDPKTIDGLIVKFGKEG